MTGPESGTDSGLDGKAAVRIAIEADGIQGQTAGKSRTVLPEVEVEDAAAWKLWGGKSQDSETLLVEFSSPPTIYLETGTWNFTLKGYKDDALILEGNIPSQDITLEGPNDLSFIVAPVLEGTGTFKITIELPFGHGITGAKVFKDGLEIDRDITPDAGSSSVVFEESDYPAGDYYFSIQLYKDNELYGVVSEVVQVRGNLGSEKTYTLTLEDLKVTYTITYHLEEGQFDNSVENPGYYQSTDTDITLPIPARGGYTFGGWYDNAELDGSEITKVPQGSGGNKTFYAKWTLVTYTIDYRLNGGTNNDENPASYTVESADITLLTPPTPMGYDFGGWYDNEELTGSAVTGIPQGSGGNKTFYAKWTLVAYAITYELNGGTNGENPPASYTVESSGITLPTTLTRTGYTFGGWYDNAELDGSPVTGIPQGGAGNKTFYAQWTAVPYAITYHLNGGTNNSGNPASYTVGSPAIILLSPSLAGYGFSGWYDNEELSGSAVTGIPQGSMGNKTFYAKWKPGLPVTITLRPQPGEPLPSDTMIIFEDEGAQFSAAGIGYRSWQWYWEGTPLSGANSDTYTLEADSASPGIYELSVVVTTNEGALLSARRRVTINERGE
jgi:uncharacterized repeat protein (TIGR02543 family)